MFNANQCVLSEEYIVKSDTTEQWNFIISR